MPGSGSHGSRSAESWNDEIEKRHIAPADGRLLAGDGRGGCGLPDLRMCGRGGPDGACLPVRMSARCAGLRSGELLLRMRTPFDRGRTLCPASLRQQRTSDPVHGHRPASRNRCGVSFSGTSPRSAGKERRKADTFRAGSLDSSCRLPGPSRIGLKLLRDRCCVHRSAISFKR